MAYVVSNAQNFLEIVLSVGGKLAELNCRLVTNLVSTLQNIYNTLHHTLYITLPQAGQGLKTALSRLGQALSDTCLYAGDLLLDCSSILAAFIKLCEKIILLIFYIIHSLVLGLMYIFEGVVTGGLTCLSTLFSTLTDLSHATLDYMTWVLGSTGADLSLLGSKGYEVISGSVNNVTETLKHSSLSVATTIVHSFNSIGDLINCGICSIFEHALNQTQQISHTAAWWVDSANRGIVEAVYSFRNGCCSILLNLWTTFKEGLYQLAVGAWRVGCSVVTSIPVQIYLYILGTTLIIFMLKYILNHMHKHGMTFPLFNLQSRRRSQYNLMHGRHYTIDSSDEDSLSGGDTYDEAEFPQVQTNLDNIPLFDMGVDFDLRAESDDDSGTEGDEASEEEEDGVEEYEVVSDSESEDGSEAPIEIKLPEKGTRYSLRTRASPLPDDPSFGDLGKVLENERDKRLCVVCQDQLKNVLVLPCRHMCLCVECAHEIVDQRNPARRVCPLCRSRIETVMDVYV